MEEQLSGFDLLEQLRKSNGEQVQRFSNLTRFLSIKARERGIPIDGQFELTPLCNFDCKMCYVHLEHDQMAHNHILPVAIWKSIIHQAWEMGMIRATISGGECLTYPDFEELFIYLHSLGCEVSVLTNGFLLDDKRIQFFKEHTPSLIQVTLYGWNDDVYERVTGRRAFRTVYDNIRKAKEAGLTLSISITPSVYLGEDALETVRMAKTLCERVVINPCLFTPREETGRSEHHDDADTELYVKIYQLLNELNGRENKRIPEEKLPKAGGPSDECKECGLRCGGGRAAFSVDWKGRLSPCSLLTNISKSVPETGFREAWKYINHEANRWPRVPECEGCVYERVCNNCAAYIIECGEAGKRPVELCERTRYLVKNGVWNIPDCE